MSKHQKPDVIGILLVYYEKYAFSAISEFTKLIRSVKLNSKIIVVLNGAKLNFSIDSDIIQVTGDNSLREFSGWDKGISSARDLGFLYQSKLLVFANDTFCYHNRFGIFTRYRFRAEFRNRLAIENDLSIVGEKFALGANASINGLPFDSWISTYLFGISTRLLLKLNQVSPTFTLEEVFCKSADGKQEMTDLISKNLSRYMENWLGVRTDRTDRWYGAQDGKTMSVEEYRGKAGSILCEKSLSASCENLGGKLIDVFPRKIEKQLRRFEKFLPRHR